MATVFFRFRACIESLRRVKKFGVSERKVNISRGFGLIAAIHTSAKVWVSHAEHILSKCHYSRKIPHLIYKKYIIMIDFMCRILTTSRNIFKKFLMIKHIEFIGDSNINSDQF
jgi:hypothetical protein